MEPYFDSTWTISFWFLWMALISILFSSVGNWGYAYSAHRKFKGRSRKALDILNERFAKGELALQEYRMLKAELVLTNPLDDDWVPRLAQ